MACLSFGSGGLTRVLFFITEYILFRGGYCCSPAFQARDRPSARLKSAEKGWENSDGDALSVFSPACDIQQGEVVESARKLSVSDKRVSNGMPGLEDMLGAVACFINLNAQTSLRLVRAKSSAFEVLKSGWSFFGHPYLLFRALTLAFVLAFILAFILTLVALALLFFFILSHASLLRCCADIGTLVFCVNRQRKYVR